MTQSLSFEPEPEAVEELKLQNVEDKELTLRETVVSPVVQKAKSFAVTDNASNEAAAEFLKNIKSSQKQVKDFFAESKQKAAEAHKAICANENSMLKPLQESEALLKNKMSAFWEAQEKIRIEAERKAAEEAEKTNASALEALEAGDEEKAQRLAMESAMKAAEVQVSAPQKIKGITTSQVWTFEVEDFNLVPREYLVVNEQALSALAKSTKGSFKVPGIKFVPKTQIAARTA